MIEVAEQAISILRKEPFPESKIMGSSCYWIPLQWLYVRLIENKDLTPLSELESDKKEFYWSLVKEVEKPQWVKICLCQSLYVYEYLKH